MVEKVLSMNRKHRIAVAWAQDINTISAVHKAVNFGLADAVMIGQSSEITVRLPAVRTFQPEAFSCVADEFSFLRFAVVPQRGFDATLSQRSARVSKTTSLLTALAERL